MHSIHLSKSIECTIPRVNPKVNHGLWMIMMCQHTFISCKKWWGEAMHVGGGQYVNISMLSSQFCCEPKPTLKITKSF